MHNISILFVDDETDTKFALERFLRKETYMRFYAENGHEALHVLSQTPIDILVTDMKMPGMDGLTLLHHVKQRYPDIIRLALSAYTMAGQLLPTINSGGIFRYITKPIDPAELRKSLNDAVDFSLMHKERMVLVNELKQKNEELQSALERQTQIEKQLRQLAITDELTGLYNRRYLTLSLEKEFDLNKRYGTDCSLFMIELDQYDHIRKTKGSVRAEQALCEFSTRLKQFLRSSDMGFRCEGRSFLLLLPNTSIENAAYYAERIMANCQNVPIYLNGEKTFISISIGMVSINYHMPSSPQAMLDMADEKCNEATRCGRNQVVYG